MVFLVIWGQDARIRPAEQKKLLLYDTDHFVPRNELIKETLAWLDKYLGHVNK
jgi:hypothetical protein